MTAAGVKESHPHDVTITREAPDIACDKTSLKMKKLLNPWAGVACMLIAAAFTAAPSTPRGRFDRW